MSEMVERVRRAVAARRWACAREAGGQTCEVAEHCECRETARAAIEAMREPTEAMADKADDQFDWGPSGYYDAPQGSAYPEGVWRVMIDAALAKPTEPREPSTTSPGC